MPRDCTYRDPNRPSLLRCTECGGTLEICTCLDPINELAHHRLYSPGGRTLSIVADLVREADTKNLTNTHLLSQATATLGKIHDLLTAHDHAAIGLPPGMAPRGDTTARDIHVEIVKLAALTVRLAYQGDRDFAYDPAAIYGE